MTYPDESPLVGKDQLISAGVKVFSDLYDAAPTEHAKRQVQWMWYRTLHSFSANTMMMLQDDFEVDRCPSDMERCRDGSCMPPGQC